ncbi:MAG: hypothetical protein FWG87_12615 [Defluviitaleaceae bacterium]|nr:hypothetical protein [Defluviitaleaceae bacterium]
MKKQLRKANGLALPTVVLFIIMMATVGTLMVVVSNRSMKMSNVTPTLDGHFYAAEAAINRAMPEVVSDLADDSDKLKDVAKAILEAASDVIDEELTKLEEADKELTEEAPPCGDDSCDYKDACVGQWVREKLYYHATFPAKVVTEIGTLLVESGVAVKFTNGGYSLISDTNQAVDGFNVPAHVDLLKEGASIKGINFDIRTGYVSATEVQIDIMPYITLTSTAGTVELEEKIVMATTGFVLNTEKKGGIRNAASFDTLDGNEEGVDILKNTPFTTKDSSDHRPPTCVATPKKGDGKCNAGSCDPCDRRAAHDVILEGIKEMRQESLERRADKFPDADDPPFSYSSPNNYAWSISANGWVSIKEFMGPSGDNEWWIGNIEMNTSDVQLQ